MVEPPTTFGVALTTGLAIGLFEGLAAFAFGSRRSVRALSFSTCASAFWLRSQAFSSASHSTPLCSAKPASSDAITARFRFAEMRS